MERPCFRDGLNREITLRKAGIPITPLKLGGKGNDPGDAMESMSVVYHMIPVKSGDDSAVEKSREALLNRRNSLEIQDIQINAVRSDAIHDVEGTRW